MNTLIATDLDRTMIYSHSALALGGPSAVALDAAPHVGDADLLCVEIYEHKPLSYVTRDAAALLRALAAVAVVVPTTTRTIAQFDRIELPGAPWRYAITSNGGTILVDGTPDRRWRAGIDAATRATGATLDQVTAELGRRIGDQWVRTFRVADELFCYLVVEPDAVPDGFLAEWDHWCREHGWGASQQGRKVYTMPNAVCKSRAVAEVRDRLTVERVLTPEATLLAAGDGALDAEMLVAADAAIRPRHGELEALGWQHPTVTVTDRSGIAAGEEILRWFSDRVMHTVPSTAEVVGAVVRERPYARPHP